MLVQAVPSRVPKLATFVYVEPMPFGLVHAIAIATAARNGHFDTIRFVCERVPTGKWWKSVENLVEIVTTKAPTRVFGVALKHPSHVADVMRLDQMRQVGGTFLDLDVITLGDFSDFLCYPCTLGVQRLSNGDICGLGCAVVICHASSEFVESWYMGYDPHQSRWEGFRSSGDDEHWSEMSTRYPFMLANLMPEQVHTVKSDIFYPYSWDNPGLVQLFQESGCLNPETKCLHLWQKNSWERYLKNLTPSEIRDGKSRFTQACLRAIEGDFGWAKSG